MEHESVGDTNCCECTWNSLQSQGLRKKTGGIENQRKNQDYLGYSIVKIGQNIHNSPGYQRRREILQGKNNGRYPCEKLTKREIIIIIIIIIIIDYNNNKK